MRVDAFSTPKVATGRGNYRPFKLLTYTALGKSRQLFSRVLPFSRRNRRSMSSGVATVPP